MKLGAVTLVLVEAIFGKLSAEVTHDPVARDFCNHAGGGDGQTEAIAIDDGSLREWKRKNRKPVDQHVLRRHCQLTERDSHRLMRGSENVDSVNLNMINCANAAGDFGIRNELFVYIFAQLWVQLFGIIQFPMPEFFRQDNCRGHHRPC